ncbi:hypothetical protein LCGC14_0166540 [marine sediment metagenome]|uniref:Transglutaminase-like domain-containing protein n=1 Tax=marine sediment metagenome TaxID=412755 RepID=A0A0F9XW87_9ZZZZ|nr:transglutaminase domain-containing protein [Maribacter sp.]HDZ07110.1 DUF3857 domain-containing protein [Maribacter sp.]
MYKSCQLVFLFLFLLSVTVINAQDKVEFSVLSESESTFTSYEKDSAATAVYLYEYGNNYFEIRDNYIWLITKYHAKIKILEKEGFDYSNIEIPLYRSKDRKEKIVKIKGLTHNGEVKTYVKKPEFFEEEVSEKWSQIKFTFPNIKEGSIIEYEYEMQSPFYFTFTGWSFQEEIPKLYSEFNAKIPGNWLYNRSLKGELDLAVNEAEIVKGCFKFPGTKDDSDCEALKYVMKDIPAFEDSEEYMLSSNNYRSKLEFELSEYKSFYGGTEKYTKSWEDVDKEFKTDKDIGSQLRKKNFFEKNVDKKLLTEGDELTRAKNIFEFVKDHFTWNEKYSIWQDNKVKTAFDEKRGNVAEINIALINLLNAADIEANMMVLATRNRGLPKKTHPVMNDFNYLVAKVDIGGESYLLDATNKYMPFGMLPFRCLNYYGRVMDFDNESYWYDIVPEKSNSQMIRAQMTIDPIEKKLSGIFDYITMGYKKVSQEEILETTKEEDYLEKLEEEISDDFHIVSHEKKLEYSDEKKITERFNFEIENVFQGDNIYLNPFAIKFFEKNPFTSSERNYPVDFGYTTKYQYILNMKVPDGYKLKSIPENKNFTLPNNGGILKLNVSKNEIGSLNLFFTFELNSAHYTNGYYSGIKQLFNEAVKSQNQSLIVLEKI